MSRDDREAIDIGTFEVTSGSIVVKDPCYDDASGSTFPAKNGTWTGYIHRQGRTVASLEARASGPQRGIECEVCKEGVESGQMGIFNASDSERSREDDYDQICNMTLNGIFGGIINQYGVVSGTAYGDGVYPVLVRREVDGTVTSVRIEFIDTIDGDFMDRDDI